MSSELAMMASHNLDWLRENEYPGRGIVCGLDESGQHIVQIYWLMGRSPGSRNRVLRQSGVRVFTDLVEQRGDDTSLTLYTAMREEKGYHVVSNGEQTDAVLNFGGPPYSLARMLDKFEYEPDAPHFTQRITAMTTSLQGQYVVAMNILRKSMFGDGCDRIGYRYDRFSPGFGYCITTYAGNGNPLPPNCGDPKLVPLQGDTELLANTYWDALNAENRVALAVKFVDLRDDDTKVHIINRHAA